jgi:hypothetical protein
LLGQSELQTGLSQRGKVTTVLAGTRIGEHLAGCHGKFERVIEFPIGQQSGIRSNNQSAKLEDQPAVEIQSRDFAIRFTRRFDIAASIIIS